jgi:hypothetical protein
MRKLMLLVLAVAIGGFFSGCTATRAWVQETLSESVGTLKKESKGAIDALLANVMASLKEQGSKWLEKVPSIAKGAAQALLDAAEKKRKEALAKEIVKIDLELMKVVPDLSYDADKDGAVTCRDFLDSNGDLSPSASLRMIMYYERQPAKEGQGKDPNALLYAIGAVVLLVGAGKVGQVVGAKKAQAGGGAPTPPPKTG